MKKQQVLATLMAATMIATSAAPAVTTFAAEEVVVGANDTRIPEAINNEVVTIAGEYGEVPTVTLADGTVLTQGVDFEFDTDVAELKNRAAGTYRVTLHGIGKYNGFVQEKEYKVSKKTVKLTLDLQKKAYQEGEVLNDFRPILVANPDSVKNAVKYEIKNSVGEVIDSYAATVNDTTVEDLDQLLMNAAGKTTTYTIQAIYAGDANHAEAKSNVVEFTIEGSDKVNTPLDATISNSVYGETPKVKVPETEKRVVSAKLAGYVTYTETVNGRTVTKTKQLETYQGKVLADGTIDVNGDGIANDIVPAGTYVATIYADETETYNLSAAVITDQRVTVEKRTLDSVTPYKTSIPYTGRNQHIAENAVVKALNHYELVGNAYVLTLGTVEAEHYDIKAYDENGVELKKNEKGQYYALNAGTYTIEAVAKKDNVTADTTYINNFGGSVKATVTITGERAQNVTITAKNAEYDGRQHAATAKASTKDIKITYTDAAGNTTDKAPVDAGTYTVTAVAAGDKNYAEGKATAKFTITPFDISIYNNGKSWKNVVRTNKDLSYNGKVQLPTFDIYGVGKDEENAYSAEYIRERIKKGFELSDLSEKQLALEAGKDYDVVLAEGFDGTSATDYTTAKNQKAYIVFKGNYTNGARNAKVPYVYEIDQLELTDALLDKKQIVVTAAEAGKVPTVTVLANDGSTIPAADYTVSVTNNNDAGQKATVVVKAATKNLTGKATATYKVATAAQVNQTEMFRVYNPNSGEHFFTANAQEVSNLSKLGWKAEGVAWKAPKNGGIEVYRLYNPNAGEHHYTTNAAERTMLVKAGWKYEGIGWYAAEETEVGAVAVYRVYNPNAFSNNHHYTTSEEEYKMLVKAGWKDEGVAFYEFAAK